MYDKRCGTARQTRTGKTNSSSLPLNVLIHTSQEHHIFNRRLSINNIETEIVDSTKQICGLVDRIILVCEDVLMSPRLYIDLEGIALSREGPISILTLLIDTGSPRRTANLIDVHTWGAQAFNTMGAKKKTLKEILEDERIPKVFFDVRNDSDALFAHFGIALHGVEDLQLMDSVTRKTTASRRLLSSLTKCIEDNIPIAWGVGTEAERRAGIASWKSAKQRGERLFQSQPGGSYEAFNERPIPDDISAYCVGDVRYLPDLLAVFWRWPNSQWRDLVREESKKRVAESQRPDYQPHGRDRVKAPWTVEQNSALDCGNREPVVREDDMDDDWHDEGGINGRDIIMDYDMNYYYSD